MNKLTRLENNIIDPYNVQHTTTCNQMPISLSNFLKPVNVELFQFCIILFIIIIDKIVCML